MEHDGQVRAGKGGMLEVHSRAYSCNSRLRRVTVLVFPPAAPTASAGVAHNALSVMELEWRHPPPVPLLGPVRMEGRALAMQSCPMPLQGPVSWQWAAVGCPGRVGRCSGMSFALPMCCEQAFALLFLRL